MNDRREDMLKRAFDELAQEETQALEKRIEKDADLRCAAGAMYMCHRPAALKLIGEKTGGRSGRLGLLAACLALAIAAAWRFAAPGSQPPPEAFTAPSATVQPMTTAAPWPGNFYPAYLPKEANGKATETERSVGIVWTLPGGQTLHFTEEAESRLYIVPEDAKVSYVAMGDGLAMVVETTENAAIVWDREGQTLILKAAQISEEMLKIAQSVHRIN